MKIFGMADDRVGTTVLNLNLSLTLKIGGHRKQIGLLGWSPRADRTAEMLPSVRGPCVLEGEYLPESDEIRSGDRLLLDSERGERGSLVDTTI